MDARDTAAFGGGLLGDGAAHNDKIDLKIEQILSNKEKQIKQKKTKTQCTF